MQYLEAAWWPMTNASVLLPCGKFTDAQFREVLLVTLVDLGHWQIFLTHCVGATLHF